MKVVVAIDSFKGSLSSMDAGLAVKEGILKAKNAEVIVKPMADGGEGTMRALADGLGGRIVSVTVTGPLGTPTCAQYGILNNKTAVIEMAEAAGITLVSNEELDPMRATTFGVGEMIVDAVSKGCRDFIVGIGGSATTDGGTGMLEALGYEFLDEKGRKINRGIRGLSDIAVIQTEHVMPDIKDCQFTVACDVTNPLFGKYGAVHVYGPQKGVAEEQKELLDEFMKHYAEKTKEVFHKDFSMTEGAGAAGGLGFAFLSYLNAKLRPGITIVSEAVMLEDAIKDADYVITGEGRLDKQTVMGKVPIGVAKLAKKYGAKVIAFAGSVTDDARICNEYGIDAFFPIVRGIYSLMEAMEPEKARTNLTDTAEQVFHLL